jgi:hypothetical protein
VIRVNSIAMALTEGTPTWDRLVAGEGFQRDLFTKVVARFPVRPGAVGGRGGRGGGFPRFRHRMGHAGVTRVVVTRPDGTLVGLFFAADLPA